MTSDKSDPAFGKTDKRAKNAKRKGNRGVGVLIAVLVFLLLQTVAIALAIAGFFPFIPVVRAELGSDMPKASRFSSENMPNAEYVDVDLPVFSDAAAVDMSSVGIHLLVVDFDGASRPVLLIVSDTTAPTATAVENTISIIEELSPSDAVTDVYDESRVRIGWQSEPAFGVAGDSNAVVRLTDTHGNRRLINVVVHIEAVKNEVIYDIGNEPPVICDFLADEGMRAKFLVSPNDCPLDLPGSYRISIEAYGAVYDSTIVVRDEEPPKVIGKNIMIKPGDMPDASMFVESASDATTLGYFYEKTPDFVSEGIKKVKIEVRDLGGNSTVIEQYAVVSELTELDIELTGLPVTLDDIAESFSGMGYNWVEFKTEAPTADKTGDLFVTLNADGVERYALLRVVDTVAPTADPAPVSWYVDNELSPEVFITNAYDAQGFECAFASAPDFSLEGVQIIDIKLTDPSGNQTIVTSELTLSPDIEPPKIFGVKSRYLYVDQPVSYFFNVWAEDNCDSSVEVTVEASGVDIHKEGSWLVTYSATDRAGNTATETCWFTFKKESVSMDTLNEKVDEMLSYITTEDMTMGEKAYSIYNWIINNISYTGSSDNTDWQKEAYKGLTKRYGHCFTYYATARAMLERIGAEVIPVQRKPGGARSSTHFWCLVNLGDGWYHFDALGCYGSWCFMKTDQEVRRINYWYYYFDSDLYPATPSESYGIH